MTDNKQNTFAEEGLQEIEQETAATVAVTAGAAATEGVDDEQMTEVGFEPIKIWFRFKEGEKPQPSDRILTEGMVLLGVYEGSFKGGKFERMTHKIRLTAPGTADDKALAGLPSSGQLDKLFEQSETGAKVKVIYRGQSPIKKGKFKDSLAHNFSLATSRPKKKSA